jgi:hypothetical protein
MSSPLTAWLTTSIGTAARNIAIPARIIRSAARSTP